MENWYPLLNIQKTMENHHIQKTMENHHRNRDFSHEKWWIFPYFFVCSPEGQTPTRSWESFTAWDYTACSPHACKDLKHGTGHLDWKFGWTSMNDYGWKSTWKWVLVSLDESRFESGCFSPEARESGWITMDFFDIHLSYSMLDGSQPYIQINVCNWMYRA